MVLPLDDNYDLEDRDDDGTDWKMDASAEPGPASNREQKEKPYHSEE